MTDKLVIIAEFPSINQAGHAQMHLESAGIDSFLEDGEVTTMQFLAIGVKFRVMESHAAQALAMLNEKEPEPEVAAETQPAKYAGFWFRSFAYLLDVAVLVFFYLPLTLSWEVLEAQSYVIPKEVEFIVSVIIGISNWLYFALMESSRYQATLGKRFFGITVTDWAGNRISFLRASVRYWAKLFSVFTAGIGFVMAGFTPKKQALHDIMANCLVVRKYNPAKDKL